MSFVVVGVFFVFCIFCIYTCIWVLYLVSIGWNIEIFAIFFFLYAHTVDVMLIIILKRGYCCMCVCAGAKHDLFIFKAIAIRIKSRAAYFSVNNMRFKFMYWFYARLVKKYFLIIITFSKNIILLWLFIFLIF